MSLEHDDFDEYQNQVWDGEGGYIPPDEDADTGETPVEDEAAYTES